MASDPVPPSETPPPPPQSGVSGPSPFTAWFERTGLHGKLIIFGALAGVICSFLPLVSFGPISAMGIDAAEGVLSLLGYLALIALCWFAYQPKRNPAIIYAILGVAGLVALLALIMLIRYSRAGGIGLYLNIIAAGVVAAGAFMKAKDEKIF
jgi:hypothetical protein